MVHIDGNNCLIVTLFKAFVRDNLKCLSLLQGTVPQYGVHWFC